MGDLGKGGDVRVNPGDAGIESVEKVKLVEEAHAPLLCHRVCDSSAVAGHPALGYTPVHYCGLADTGALCIPTPGAYQSITYSGVDTHRRPNQCMVSAIQTNVQLHHNNITVQSSLSQHNQYRNTITT